MVVSSGGAFRRPARPSRFLGRAGLAVAAVVLLAGCSSGDDPAPSAAPDSSTTAPSSASPGADPPGIGEFCERAESFNQVLGSIDANSIESFDVIASEVADLSAAAPPEIAGDLATMSGYWNELAAVDTDDPTQVGRLTQRNDEVVTAGQRVTAYLVDECGITPVE